VGQGEEGRGDEEERPEEEEGARRDLQWRGHAEGGAEEREQREEAQQQQQQEVEELGKGECYTTATIFEHP